MQNRTRRLWGQEINIVKGGLDEEQVVGLVGGLMAKYRALVERQEHFLSLGTLSEKAAIEGDKLAAEIKARAKGEAEADATSTVARANQRAQEMIAVANKTAQDVTRREADGILDGAHRKAHTIETEAKQRAQLFLIRARAAIENDLKGQFIQVYDQLLSALRDLLADGHDVESKWKGKIVELWRREALELESYEAVPSILAGEIAKASSLTGAKIEIPQEELIAKEKEVFYEVSSKESIVPEVSPPEEVGYEAPPAPPVPEGVDTLAPEEVKPEAVPSEPKVELPPAYMGDLEGEIDINLVPPVELSVMSTLLASLQESPEVKILRTLGSYDKGTTITILLEEPVPLVSMLTGIPGVEIAPLTPQKQGFLKKTAAGDKDIRKITIPLRTRK
ncbi:MAG: hypothetical protein ISS53_00770 [Dehalococcoidia bacterium]|nr:hypothetical protein [Dehalococcoidia bacterium]